MHKNFKVSPRQIKLPIAIAVASLCFVTAANAQLVVYERSDFSGRSFTTNQEEF
jgi:hypothetical protein